MADNNSAGLSPLGKKSEYVSVYTPSLLCPIPRHESRTPLGIKSDSLPFSGVDLWTGYELSWLDSQGKPQVAVAQFQFPCSNPNLVESKSFKLYLNSFNQTRFNSLQEVVQTLESDLGIASAGPVSVEVMPLSKAEQLHFGHFPAESIDELDVSINAYQPAPTFLSADQQASIVKESLCSNLLKTNCPVTGQPDWASVLVSYRGCPIDRDGLLRYIVSFREHQDFHENCVERMFVDIMKYCQPEELTVYARYTRRGGLDINPYRTNGMVDVSDLRLVRQ
ncbi:NADPH-dependent 7-cyano-7-deazaguanine reductase QueF [Aurantivibrio plasticivorans]